MSNRITAISVAGFKALPHDDPPVVHLPGITVLTGTNSSGKSSLILALRILKESLLEESDGARLYLRARGLPQHREMTVQKLFHFGDTERPIRYRICGVVDGEPAMMELAYRWGGKTHHAGSQVVPFSPLTLRLESRTVYEWGAGAVGADAPEPWGESWSVSESDGLRSAMTQLAFDWGKSSAALDSIRGRSLSPTEDAWGGEPRSDLVWPCGGNAVSLAGRECAVEGEVDHTSWIPGPGPGAYESRGLDRDIGVLCSFLGLDETHSLGMGPGLPPLVGAFLGSGGAAASSSDERGAESQAHYLSDFGDGLQQVYPAMAQMALSAPGTCLLWEHPDLHLHPAASTQLGRLIYLCAHAGRSIIVETHSRDLVDGIRLQAWASRAGVAQAAAAHGGVAPASLARATLLGFWRNGAEQGHSSHDLVDQSADLPWPGGFVDQEQADREAFRESLVDKIRPGDVSYVARFIDEHEEGQGVEYKAAYRWNEEEQRNDERIRLRALQAICGMLNSHGGGVVIFGVDDARRIVGIAHDTGGVADDDKFQRVIVQDVARRLDATVYERCCRMSFTRHDSGMVAMLECRPAGAPVWLDQRHFYLRKGNRSEPLATPEAVAYCRRRWPDPS